MIRVNNKKVINRIANKSFRASRIRNLIAVLAIALTTILFTSLFTIGIGIVQSIQQQTVRQAGGDGHIALKYLTEEQYQKVKTHPLIDEISYNKIIADSVDNMEFLKRTVEMYYMDETGMKLGFCTPTTGTAPKAENEISADTMTLELLGVPARIGATVPLEYTIKGKTYRTEFVLSGFWESDPAVPIGYTLVSEAFTKANADILTNTVKSSSALSGAINSYIMCKNTFDLESKLERIITESGYTLASGDPKAVPLESDIAANTNWAYLGGSLDPETALGGSAALLLFAFAGYLIIYNVFQISVQRDIRFYGLLKTIGTTGRQLKLIIRRQALLLSLIGIPLGLFLGFLIGKTVLPLLMDVTTYGSDYVTVSMNPVIFLSAIIFALGTVMMSTRKPGKMAAAVSPIEAVKYSGNNEIKRSLKHSQNGGKVWRMAFSNLSRNRKRTIITILSLSLSLVLFNSIYTLAQGFDMDKYLSRFVDTDYLAGHANYFNRNHFRMPEDSTSEQMIASIEAQEDFLEGGRLYKNLLLGRCSIERENPAEVNLYPTNFADDGMPILDLYGLDDLPLSRLDLVEGTLDMEKLATGKYIIEGLLSDDDGMIYPESSHYEIGDIVTINVDGKQYEYELLAKIRTKHYTNTDRFGNNYTMYLPSAAFKQAVAKPLIMSYAFNVKEGTSTMESFLESYTGSIEPTMNFESKEKYVTEFIGMQNMIITVGGVLSALIGVIGVLNFVNSIITGIIARRREFAMLQSIGMTKRQLITMLMFEGSYYTLLTATASLALCILFSAGVIGTLVINVWFFSYQFTLLPIMITCPILLVLGLLIPWLAYCGTGRQSIVERLREAE